MNFNFSLEAPKLSELNQKDIDDMWELCRELKEKLNANPKNSSVPPSTVKPFERQTSSQPKEPWRKKKPGAVIGHKGFGRTLLPIEHVHEVIACYPYSECIKCQALVKTVKYYSRKQVCDLPQGKLHITEYQLYRGRCIGCKKRYAAELPSNVPKHLLGNSALAKISLITGKYHLSKRLAAQLLFDFFGLKLSIGTVSNAEAKVSEALKIPVEIIEKEVQSSERLHADETSFFLKHKLQWLWVAASENATLFKIFPKRDTESAKKLIGESYQGLVNTDRYGAYHWIADAYHQYCWAHIIRDFRKISERENPKEAYIGTVLLSQAQTIIKHWIAIKKNRNQSLHKLYKRLLKDCPEQLLKTLQRGIELVDTKTAKFCQNFIKHWDCLWHFLRKPNVEPTNNTAERALRSAVIWRKICYGVQSERGLRFVERIFSVLETCRQRSESALIFIEKALSPVAT